MSLRCAPAGAHSAPFCSHHGPVLSRMTVDDDAPGLVFSLLAGSCTPPAPRTMLRNVLVTVSCIIILGPHQISRIAADLSRLGGDRLTNSQ
jgi:hypothetical protein